MSKLGRPVKRRKQESAPKRPRPSGPAVREQALRARYEGRPLLLILESYVLVVIGEWPAERNEAILGLVQGLWGGGADWTVTLRKELALDAAMDQQISRNWAAYREAKQQQGQSVSAGEFARMFADAIMGQTHGAADAQE